MSRSWNCKAFIDRMAVECWDSSETFRGYLINWINEIQDDILSEIPIKSMRIKMKKLLPTDNDIISLSPERAEAPTSAIGASGSLVDTSSYKAYVTFLIYNEDGREYIESEPSEASAERTADATNKTLSLTVIPVYSGDTSIEPLTIKRRIYIASKVQNGEYGEPFFSADIDNNTATTLSITSEPTSTITPPSDTEVDQITSNPLNFATGDSFLTQINMSRIDRYNPIGSTSTTPNSFDYAGLESIFLWPKLDDAATTSERTLTYYVYRRAHEVFYDVTRKMDIPIICRKAMVAGVLWKAYEFRDRNGAQTKASNYEIAKKQLQKKIVRQRGRPDTIRDVNGDTQGYEV